MNQNTYPKTFTHRDDHMSSVVVMNVEQESQLPVEYLPARTGTSGQTVSAADLAADAMLSPEYDALLAEREKLEKDRAEFADLVNAAQQDAAAQHQELAEGRAKLEAEREELTAGYKGAMEQLEADRAAWEASKHAQAPEGTGDTASAPAPATTAPAPAAGPAKRVRTAKAD